MYYVSKQIIGDQNILFYNFSGQFEKKQNCVQCIFLVYFSEEVFYKSMYSTCKVFKSP